MGFAGLESLSSLARCPRGVGFEPRDRVGMALGEHRGPAQLHVRQAAQKLMGFLSVSLITW